MKTLTDIFSLGVVLLSIVSSPRLWSMVLHLPVTYSELKIFIVT